VITGAVDSTIVAHRQRIIVSEAHVNAVKWG
jgi:hypothetical protein